MKEREDEEWKVRDEIGEVKKKKRKRNERKW